MTDHRVNVENGKYTFLLPEGDYRVSILRHGEPWHVQSEAGKALHAITCELDAARVVVQAARELVAESGCNTGSMAKALDQHDRLCEDNEKPSEWTRLCECAGGEYGGHDLDCRNRT